jgi:hypothetical protein
VAEWSCSGLQHRLRRFDSDPSLQYTFPMHRNLLIPDEQISNKCFADSLKIL